MGTPHYLLTTEQNTQSSTFPNLTLSRPVENYPDPMPVLQLTIFISILLAVIFVTCFALEAWRNKGRGSDRTALLPLLEDEEPISKNKHTDSK